VALSSSEKILTPVGLFVSVVEVTVMLMTVFGGRTKFGGKLTRGVSGGSGCRPAGGVVVGGCKPDGVVVVVVCAVTSRVDEYGGNWVPFGRMKTTSNVSTLVGWLGLLVGTKMTLSGVG